MKYLTDRQEIAKAMNFGIFPVIRIDVETSKAGYDGVFEGDFVKVATPSSRYPDSSVRARVMKFKEDGDKYAIMPETVCIHDSFGYGDVLEMLRFAQAPMLHAGDTVIVIEDFPKQKKAGVRMMKVSDRPQSFVYPTCYLEDIKEES